MIKNILIKSPDEWATTKQACRDESVVYLFLSSTKRYIYIYRVMSTDLFSSAQNQIFEALPEGLPLSLEATPAPFPRRGRTPIPLPRTQRRQIIQTFDPLSENYVEEMLPVRDNMPEWLANMIPNNVVEENGRQVMKWHYLSGLNEMLVPRITERIGNVVQNRFKINYSYYNVLRNIDTVRTFPWLQEGMKSTWLNFINEAERCLELQERNKLDNERVERPDTQSVFDRFLSVQIKIILDNCPLRVGEGRLPEWLQKKKGIFALDAFDDNLCVFRCLVVHRGADKRYNRRQTRQTAKEFFSLHEIPNKIIKLQHIPLIAHYFNQPRECQRECLV